MSENRYENRGSRAEAEILCDMITRCVSGYGDQLGLSIKPQDLAWLRSEIVRRWFESKLAQDRECVNTLMVGGIPEENQSTSVSGPYLLRDIVTGKTWNEILEAAKGDNNG